jgi:hypothetical protein
LDAVADSFVLEQVEQEVAQIAAAIIGGRAKASALSQSAECQHLGARQRVQADPIERLGQKLDKLVKPDLERARANLHHELGIRERLAKTTQVILRGRILVDEDDYAIDAG